MFSKKKKKPQISTPTNFEHRVHTGFDKREGRYVGLPLQWASIVGNNQILKSTNRPLPLVDPSEITQTEILDLKTIVRPHFHKPGNASMDDTVSMKSTLSNSTATAVATANGLQLPKTSHVARSNSLRSSSPPRVQRRSANVPPSVPEEPSQIPMSNMQQPNPQMQLYHNAPANMPPQVGYVTKPPHPMQMNQQYNNGMNATDMKGFNGNGMAQNPISVHTEFPPAAPYR